MGELEQQENEFTQEAAPAIAAEETEEAKEAEEEEEEEEEEEVVVAVNSSTQRDINSTTPPSVAHVSRLQTHHPVAPIQVAPHSTPFQTPPPQVSIATLNSRRYTNRISLCLFLLHLAIATAAIVFFIFKAIQVLLLSTSHLARREHRVLHFWLPPIEGSAILSIILAFAWQKAVRTWPTFMIHFVLWSTFFATMTAGVLLLCFALPATSGIGVALVLFSVGTSLYNCWVVRRVPFTATVFAKALHPVDKFRGLNGPAYLVMGVGFVWVSLWCFAVIGAQNFYYPALTILGLVVSLTWTVEVMRNVVNLTVSRVIALYYLRGMQSNVQFCCQRALTYNLGSACLGSLFVPTIEALRIMARGINLMEEEDEFMFSCAHCCLRVMEFVFQYGNSWAFVHVS